MSVAHKQVDETFFCDLYEIHIRFVVSEPGYIEDVLAEYGEITDEDPDDEEGFCITTNVEREGVVLIWLREPSICKTAHEMYHAKCEIFNSRNIPRSADTEEAGAYLLQWLMAKAITFIS